MAERGFGDLLHTFVGRDMRQRGRTKAQIAQRALLAPSTVVQWEKETRRPRKRDDVVRLVAVLELSDQEANQLLSAAGYTPTTVFQRTLHQDARAAEEHIQELVRRATNKHLDGPDKDLIEWVMRDDLRRVVAAWTGYDQTRQSLDGRKWAEVSSAAKHGFDRWHLPIRQSAARYYAYLCLQKIAADQHLSEFDSALKMAHQALSAAEVATDLPLQTRIYCRLGDICKFQGRYGSSQQYYTRGLKIIEQWRTADPRLRDEGQDQVERRWMDHWEARIWRKKASLFLLQGRAADAKLLLDQAERTFVRLGSEYELARTHYSLGWSYSVLGQWRRAFVAHGEGLRIIERIDRRRGYPDTAQLIEGYLCLASDCLHLEDFEQAEEHIQQAEGYLTLEPNMTATGRAHQYNSLFALIRARLYRETGSKTSAEEDYSRALEIAVNRNSKSPSRLASIYNSWGVLYIKDGNFDEAMLRFTEAEGWARRCEPPNIYFLLGSLINQCAVLLLRGEDDYGIDLIVKKTQRLCDESKFPLDWIRLNGIVASRDAMRGNWHAMLIAVQKALSASARVEGSVTRRLLDQVRWFALHGPRELLPAVRVAWEAVRPPEDAADTVTRELEQLVSRLEEDASGHEEPGLSQLRLL